MKLEDVEKRVLEEIKKHNLKGWKFEWLGRRKNYRRIGDCCVRTKVIRIQPIYVELYLDEVIINTILHEIAHALTPNSGHNKFWKRKAIEIGCDGRRQSNLKGKKIINNQFKKYCENTKRKIRRYFIR